MTEQEIMIAIGGRYEFKLTKDFPHDADFTYDGVIIAHFQSPQIGVINVYCKPEIVPQGRQQRFAVTSLKEAVKAVKEYHAGR